MSYSLLFDIGNVIVTFDFQISVRRIAPMCSVAPEAIFDSVNELKDELESGQISSDEFIDQAIEKVGYSGERDFLINAFQDVFELNTEMERLIEAESKLGTPLYLLSNTNGIHVPYIFEHYPVFHRFDKAIYSHEVHCMKPDPEIYEKTIDILDIDPAKTIYIDDMAENIEAGLAHGFRAIGYGKSEHARFLEQFNEAKAEILGK